jgi:hypothetical protein
MNSSPSFAANLSNDARKGLAILSLSKAEPIAHLADREGVSRQFLYRQKQKAAEGHCHVAIGLAVSDLQP